MDQKKAHIENLKKIKNKKYFLILYIIEMDVEKDGKIFMGVGIGVGLIITIIGGSYLLQEETVSYRGETLHERLLRSTNANERLNVYKNTNARGNKTKKHDKHNKSRKHK